MKSVSILILLVENSKVFPTYNQSGFPVKFYIVIAYLQMKELIRRYISYKITVEES